MPISYISGTVSHKLTIDDLAAMFIELDNHEMLEFFESCVKQAKATYKSPYGLDYQFCWVVNGCDISQDCLNALACLQRTDSYDELLKYKP